VHPEEGMLMLGSNHLPRGVKNIPERLVRPEKYLFMEHAERDVILECANQGIQTAGCTLYAPWFSCADCARAIIGAGIIKVVGHKQIFDRAPPRWQESIDKGNVMLDEAGVVREYFDGIVGEGHHKIKVLLDGEYWTP